MDNGFYPALGTPFDEMGNFISRSFKKQVEDQIDAGASGLLALGSMGIEPYIRHSEYPNAARAAAEAAKGRCSVLVGVMDNSICRVRERIDSLSGLKIDGIVATTPYYYASSQADIKEFFKAVAQSSPYPLYLYDLPVVTKVKIDINTVKELMKEENIKGIKTGDLVTAKSLINDPCRRCGFDVIFSGLDLFDAAYKYGIRQNLDGMFSCTPGATSLMYRSLKSGDYELASKTLDRILELRDTFVNIGVFRGFTYVMNILGYEGIFCPDYLYSHEEHAFEKVRLCMEKNGLC